MGRRVNYSGLVVAGVGFVLTRFTVTLAIYEDPVRFYLAGVVPMALGLGLAAFGVGLAVADVDASLVRRAALWCLLGCGTMLVLVVLTLLGSSGDGMPALTAARSRTYLSNFLIGGSVGGTLTGLYAARTRRQRDTVRQQANRLDVLNRLLRHEILNALTAIRGYATLTGENERARTVIERRSDAIEETISEVKYLTESANPAETAVGPVDVCDSIARSVERVREEHPDADVSVERSVEGATVLANERLSQVFTHLVENAVVHGSGDGDGAGESAVGVSVTASGSSVSVAVSDDGPGLPEEKRRLLERGSIGSFDNPGTGFGLYFVRFLVESFRGTLDTEVAGGTTVTVTLPRVDGVGAGLRPGRGTLTGVRPALPHLLVTLGAALVAGVVYGLVAELIGGSVSVIGVFYGVRHPVVGWLTHEFHSVVFGFAFAGLVTLAPERYRDHVPAYVAIGAAWGLALWLLAAGVVSAVWLRLMGIGAPLPNLSVVTFVAHVAWGVSLGALTAFGYRRVTPRLADRLDRT